MSGGDVVYFLSLSLSLYILKYYIFCSELSKLVSRKKDKYNLW